MFCSLSLESRRPNLEQLELCANSHVCAVEAAVRATFENDKEHICTLKGFTKGWGGCLGFLQIKTESKVHTFNRTLLHHDQYAWVV